MTQANPDMHSSSQHRRHAVIRGGVLSGAAILFSTVAMLAVGKMVTNRLGQTEVAHFSLLLLWSDFFNIAGGLGLAVSLPKLIGAAPDERRGAIVGSCLRMQSHVFSGFVGLWWAILGVAWLSGLGWPQWQPYVVLIALVPLLSVAGAFRDMAMAALAGFNRYGARATGIAVASFAQIVLVFFCLWILHRGVGVLAAAMVASAATTALWLIFSLPSGARWNRQLVEARDCVRFSVPLYANSLLGFVFQRFDTMLIVFFLASPTAVAIYEMAKRIPMLMSRVLSAITVPFLPTLSGMIGRGQPEEAARFLARTSAMVAFLSYGGVLFTVFIQEPLLVTLFNQEYLAATTVLGLLMFAAAVGVQTGLMGQTLIALGKPGWVTSVNVGAAFFNVAANAVLLPTLGLKGAAVAAAATAFLSLAAQAWAVRKHGLCESLSAWCMPHLCMMVAGGMLWGGHGEMMVRLVALVLFVAGCFLSRVVAVRDLRTLIQAFRTPRAAR